MNIYGKLKLESEEMIKKGYVNKMKKELKNGVIVVSIIFFNL